jgi:hypothetical protein
MASTRLDRSSRSFGVFITQSAFYFFGGIWIVPCIRPDCAISKSELCARGKMPEAAEGFIEVKMKSRGFDLFIASHS